MKRVPVLALAVFSLTVLSAMVNAACSDPTELDSGMSEDQLRAGYGYGGHAYGGGYGYGAPATDVAADTAAR